MAKEVSEKNDFEPEILAEIPEGIKTTLAYKGDGKSRKRRSKFLFYLGILGPGLVAANAGNDAGGVFTYSQMGAQFGYQMLWVMVIVGIGVALIQEMCARMGATTGKGLSDLIRENFNIRWTALVMLALFIANGSLIISEFLGIKAALEIFGIPGWISAPVTGVGIWLMIARGSYARVEKIFLVLTLAFFAYIIAAFLGKPDWGNVLGQTIVPTIRPEGQYIQLLMAAVGTTISPYMQLFIQSAVVEKGVTMRDYKFEKFEVYAGSAFSILIAYFIIVATGSTLYPLFGQVGKTLQSTSEAAQSLVPATGSDAAKYIFALGLLGASLLAAGVLPLATSYSITEALGFENGVNRKFREAPVFWGMFTGLIGISVFVAALPDLPIVQILINIYVLNGVILPFILVAVLLLINNKELMGRYTNGIFYNVVAWSITGVVSVLSVLVLLLSLLGVFGIYPF